MFAKHRSIDCELYSQSSCHSNSKGASDSSGDAFDALATERSHLTARTTASLETGLPGFAPVQQVPIAGLC